MKNNISIEKIANKIRKNLNGEITVSSVTGYLDRIGYAVVLMNTEEGNELIKAYDLEEYSKGKKAFTYVKDVRIVFVDNKLSYYDKLYSLLHELGHIIFNHLDDSVFPFSNKRLEEAEAEAFVYAVMSPYKNKTAIKITVLLVSAVVCFVTGMFAGGIYIRKTDTTNKVIITSGGDSYHRIGCMSINNKDYIFIPHTDAEKIYAPCKMCNPDITQ